MLIIGLVIVAAAAVFGAVEVAQNWGGPSYTVVGFGHTLGHFTLAEIFLAGIVLAAIFFVALWMASTTSRMRRRISARRRAEARAMQDERESVVAERERLSSELEAERAAHAADLERDRETLANRPVEVVTAPGASTRPVEPVAPVAYPTEQPVYPEHAATDSYGNPVAGRHRHTV